MSEWMTNAGADEQNRHEINYGFHSTHTSPALFTSKILRKHVEVKWVLRGSFANAGCGSGDQKPMMCILLNEVEYRAATNK